MDSSGEIAPQSGLAVAPLSGQIVSRDAGPVEKAPAVPGLGVGGPLDGRVVVSSSSRLDYREPVVTVVADLDTGRPVEARLDAPALMTYIPVKVRVVGVRTYRVWALKKDYERLDPIGEYESEVILVLIDMDPRESRKCLASD